MWRELHFILDQFGGGGGLDPANNAVRFLLALYFWSALAAIAGQQYRRLRERRDLYIALAALLGAAREALMFALEYGAWRGWIPVLLSFRVFPPLEHTLTDLCRVLLGFAYLRYFLPDKEAGRRYLRVGVGFFVALYLVTAPLWVRFLQAHADMVRLQAPRFGLFWGDLAFRVGGSIFIGFVLVRLAGAARRGTPVPWPTLFGVALLFLDEFLMIFNLATGDDPLRAALGPIRHNFAIWAIPLFIWGYWNELMRRVLDEKARSESILDALGEGIGIEELDHTVLYQNPAHRALLGSHVGEPCSRMHEDGVAGCSLTRTFGGEASFSEVRSLHGGGIEIEVSTSLLRDATGQVTGGIEVVRDVTERRRAEEAIRESEERYRTLVQNIDQGIALLDAQFRVVMSNPAHARMVGRPAESIVDKQCFAAIHGRDSVCDGCPGTTALATGQNASIEKTVLRPDGRTQSVRIQAFPVHGPDGKVRGFIELVEDTTLARVAEAERRRLEERVQQTQKLESLGILAGGIAHDFNNLLMGVLGNTDLALAKTTPESPLRPFLKSIDRAAQRAADLTNQMLAYSGKGRFVIERINLSRVVEEIGHLLATVVSKRATIRYRLAAGLPAVEADATQIRQVVMNLITNASDALGEGEGTITVSTGTIEIDRDYLASYFLGESLEPGTYVSLEVSDSGVGMDRATQDRIFDPFFTTKHAGRGLGLAAVLGIVRGHHGAIKVYSEPGQGSTFKVLLPAVETSEGAAPEAGPGHEASPAPAPTARGTILVVDDEAMVRETAEAMLEERGFRVLTANDGLDAVEIFRARAPELTAVILDMTMPRMNGEEAFREMHRIAPAVPVILSSGFSEQDAVNRFAGRDIAGFIQKPYRLQTLLEKLDEALGPKRDA